MKKNIIIHPLIWVAVFLFFAVQLHAQTDPVLQQENLSGTNTISKLRTVLDWAGLVSSSNIPAPGIITNNGQIITTAVTGFQYQINYFTETGYMALGGGTSAFKFDYSTHASYGTGKPKQAALNYGAVCSSLQVARTGTYRMEVSNIAGGAVPLQFSIVDLDQSEQIQIEGYQGATYVAATLQLRSSLAGAPVITHNAGNEQVRAGFATNKADFLETSVVDVFFTAPVSKVVIRQTNNAAGNGFTLFTNFKAISSVDVVKNAGTVNATSIGSPTVFEVPYTINVANLESRGLNLNDLQVSEDLNNPFPIPGASNVTIKAGSFSVTAPFASGIAINTLFDGTTNYALLNGTGILKPNESATINFIVIITYPNTAAVPLTARNNQVHASGLPYNSAANNGGSYSGTNWTGPANTVSVDSSTNAAAPPLVANGDIPDPTPVYFGVVLPVKWISFSGRLSGNAAILSWSVGTETSNHFFTIERSTDGIKWKPIGTVTSTDNTGTATEQYSYTDKDPVAGNSWYRLKQVNSNGAFAYSSVIYLKPGSALFGVSVYPNPANDHASVTLQHATPGKKRVLLYTASGNLLYSYSWTTKQDYESFVLPDFEALGKGIYILIIREEGGKPIVRQQIVKQ
jgi:hypothetical protein